MGQNFFINLPPSGGGGDPTAAYLLVSGSDPGGQLTTFRTITAGPNIALIDGGPQGTLQISGSGVQGPAGNTGAAGSNGTNGAAGGLIFTPIFQVAANVVLTSVGWAMMSTSVGGLSASLPNPATITTGSIMVFKDVQGSASVNPFQVFPTAGAKIDGTSGSYQFYMNFGALKMMTDGHDWFTW